MSKIIFLSIAFSFYVFLGEHVSDCQKLANFEWSEWSPWDCETNCGHNLTFNAMRTRKCLKINASDSNKNYATPTCIRDERGIAEHEFMPCKFVCSQSMPFLFILLLKCSLMYRISYRSSVSID
jgi:hypothetical protein